MADYLGQQSGTDTPMSTDYLGRPVETAFKSQPALPTAGPITGGTAPSTAGGGGVAGPGSGGPGGGGGGGSKDPKSAASDALRALGLTADAASLAQKAGKFKGTEDGPSSPENFGLHTMDRPQPGPGVVTADPSFDIPFATPDRSGLTSADLLTGAEAEMGSTRGSGFDFSGMDAAQAIALLTSMASKISGNEDVGKAAQATGAAASAASGAQKVASGAEVGGGYGGALSAVGRLGTGAYGLSKSNAPDKDKAIDAAHNVGMAVSDYYTGGLSELGPLVGGAIGRDNPLGQLLLGGTDLLGSHAGESRYDAKRRGATDHAGAEARAMTDAFSRIPGGDPATTLAALRTSLDPKGSVRSYFNAPEGMEGFKAGAQQWRDMSPDQFNSVMSWIGQDPKRLSQIGGSGDVGYLDASQANEVGGQAANAARDLIARQLGLPVSRAFGLPETYDKSYYSGGDVPAAAEKERRLYEARQSWQGAPLDAWAPSYYTPPAQTAGREADPSHPRGEDPSLPATQEPALQQLASFGLLPGGGAARGEEVLEGAAA